MLLRNCIIAAVWAVGIGGTAAAADQSTQIMAVAKQAAGGRAWDRVNGWRETGEHGGHVYETLLSFRGYQSLFRTISGNRQVEDGLNGDVAWHIGPDGRAQIIRDQTHLRSARQSAFISMSAFFLPSIFAAKYTYLRTQHYGRDGFDVIQVVPEGALPIELWVDQRSHLVTRMVDRSGTKPQFVELSDFRDVAGLKVPFTLSVDDGDPNHADVGHVKSVVLEPVTPSTFQPPGA